MKSPSKLFLIGLMCLSVLAGCNRGVGKTESSPSESRPQNAPQTLTVAINPVPVSGPIYVAQEKGFFQAEGLAVDLRSFPTGKQCLDAVIGGSADLGTVAELPIVRALAAGKTPVIIGTFEASDRHIKVVSRSLVLTPATLKGWRIGVPVGTSAEYFLHRYLASGRLTMSDIKVVNLRPPDMPAAMKAQQVDAVVIWEPAAINSERARPGSIRKAFPGLYTETFNAIVMQQNVTREPEKYRRFLRGLRRATDFMKSNPDESRKIIAKSTHVNEALLKEFERDLRFVTSSDPSLKSTMSQEANWIASRGQSDVRVTETMITSAIDTTLSAK